VAGDAVEAEGGAGSSGAVGVADTSADATLSFPARSNAVTRYTCSTPFSRPESTNELAVVSAVGLTGQLPSGFRRYTR
jgi:hypothetical protein